MNKIFGWFFHWYMVALWFVFWLLLFPLFGR